MARFDVYANPGAAERRAAPYLLDAQNGFIDTAALGAVPLTELRKPVASLGEHRLDIQNALDALFGAY